MIKGTYTALMTPFQNGEVDYSSLEALFDRQVEAHVEGVVICGTTGESATLSHEEHRRVIEFAVEKLKNKVQVIAGTGSNSTREAMHLTTHAREVGADGCLLVCPYYNKPFQEGIYRHYLSIAEAVDFPCIIYNVPSRTARIISNDTLLRLSSVKNIVAVKDATGDIDFTSETISRMPGDFAVLSGNDSQTYPILTLGGRGVISVLSNIVPKHVKALCDAVERGDIEKAKNLHFELWPLSQALFCETNPIPVKAAARLLGWIRSDEVRSPLLPLSSDHITGLKNVLKQLGLSSIG